jgi:hypothetical protein
LTFELAAEMESVAFATIAPMPLAHAVGAIREHRRQIDSETRSLESIWSELIGQSERVNGEVAALRVQVLDDFKRSVAEIRGWAPRIEEAIRLGIDTWAETDNTSPDPALSEP